MKVSFGVLFYECLDKEIRKKESREKANKKYYEKNKEIILNKQREKRNLRVQK